MGGLSSHREVHTHKAVLSPHGWPAPSRSTHTCAPKFTLLGECRAFVGRAQLQHVLSMFLRMRYATGRSMTYIQVGR